MTKILCIDPGRESAWLIGSYGGNDDFEIYSLHCGQKEKTDVYDAFYAHGIVMADGVEHVVYEEPFVRSHNAARMQYRMIGIIHLIAAHSYTCKAVWPVHPSWIKKVATGKGNATKEEMIQSAINYAHTPSLKKQIDSSHAADAFWIYRYFIETKALDNFDEEEQ